MFCELFVHCSFDVRLKGIRRSVVSHCRITPTQLTVQSVCRKEFKASARIIFSVPCVKRCVSFRHGSYCVRFIQQAYTLRTKYLFYTLVPLVNLTTVYKPFFDRTAKWSRLSRPLPSPKERSMLRRDLRAVSSFYLFWNLLSANIQFSS